MPSFDWNTAIDGADTSGGDFEVLPRADYHIKIVGTELKNSASGKTMYYTKCQIQDGPHKGRILHNNFVVSPDSPVAMGILLRHLGALGLSADYLRSNPGDGEILSALQDREAIVTVGTKTYNGEERNEIKNWKPAARVPGTSPAAPAPVPSGTVSAPPVPSSSGGAEF